jgi:hypothetical protein
VRRRRGLRGLRGHRHSPSYGLDRRLSMWASR